MQKLTNNTECRVDSQTKQISRSKKNGSKTVIGHHRVVDVKMSSSTEILTPKALNILDQVPSHYNTTT